MVKLFQGTRLTKKDEDSDNQRKKKIPKQNFLKNQTIKYKCQSVKWKSFHRSDKCQYLQNVTNSAVHFLKPQLQTKAARNSSLNRDSGVLIEAAVTHSTARGFTRCLVSKSTKGQGKPSGLTSHVAKEDVGLGRQVNSSLNPPPCSPNSGNTWGPADPTFSYPSTSANSVQSILLSSR